MYDLEVLLRIREGKAPRLRRGVALPSSPYQPSLRTLLCTYLSQKEGLQICTEPCPPLLSQPLYLFPYGELKSYRELISDPQSRYVIFLSEGETFTDPQCSTLDAVTLSKTTLPLFMQYYRPSFIEKEPSNTEALLALLTSSLSLFNGDPVLLGSYIERAYIEFITAEGAFDTASFRKVLPQAQEYVSLLQPLYDILTGKGDTSHLFTLLPPQPRLITSMLHSALMELMNLSTDFNPSKRYPPEWSQWRIQNSIKYQVPSNILLRFSQLLSGSEPEILQSEDPFIPLSRMFGRL